MSLQLPSELDPPRLLSIAADLLDEITPRFLAGVGAPSAVDKGGNDFATELDLELERTITAQLTERTGIAVHGEEFGGPPVTEGTVWVVDPIDGTYNYSAGLPFAGTLLGLLHDGQPVLGLTWLPMVDMRLQAFVEGPVIRNGEPIAPLRSSALADSVIAFGAFNLDHGGRFPGRWRVDVLGEISRRVSRIRQLGSTGMDMALCAAGNVGGAVCFGHHAWDNAAGAALVRAGGGVVTDLFGAPWTALSPSMLAGNAGVHRELLEIIAAVGDPAGRS
ncbi:inositol monophosphatase family protein [Williamsia sp. CHRR-6]|uniref:inositol monophosphatase family protein n=1 Tax=Williamsia sp. CHRR-6 TaxID=2835871 RepID=UPI001BDB57C2|nr:inositol monophosphatase family protein [Williamsia sp. CHRR-6]MBT0565211.1 inositol monophosphatase family protein [Williamsia sp. CHRR-6]